MEMTRKERIGLLMKTALQGIKENGGQLPVRDVLRYVEEHVQLTEHERQRYEKSGYVRWEALIHFYSIDCLKAGWLRKNKGIWYITDDGIDALRLSPEDFIKQAQEKYREWKSKHSIKEDKEESAELEQETEVIRRTAYEQAVSVARKEIEEYISQLGAYEFQDLVAALLRGMGYYTPFISPQGKDGGFDILAYKDPFGSTTPRIKVQVKHRNQKVTVKEVRELASLLNKEGEMGLIVCKRKINPTLQSGGDIIWLIY
jgi:restriction system protein